MADAMSEANAAGRAGAHHAAPTPTTPAVRRLPLGDIAPRAEQVMVAMRDGVRLATDVYLPAQGRRFPTVIVRLPYDKSGRFSFMAPVAARFNERGYAFVVQDVRGKARSEGEIFAFTHEVADGYDTLDWVITQSWSDGVVGMFGDSYYGFTQWAAVASGHPALRAIVPRMTSTEIGTDWSYNQGVFCVETVCGWAAETWVETALLECALDWRVRPLRDLLPASLGGLRSPSLDHWMEIGPEDIFWTTGVFGPTLPRHTARIPVLHSGGWWDVLQRGQLREYHALRARPDARSIQHLIMDATDHFDDEFSATGEPVGDILTSWEALEQFLPRYVGPALDFFDRYLMGRDDRAIPAVRCRLANAGWHEGDQWPPPGAHPLHLYPAAAGRAHSGPEGGALAATPDRHPAVVRWVHDPAAPVPSLTDDPWRPLPALPDEAQVEAREDVVTFTAPPTTIPLDLAGPVALVARVQSSGPSMHLMAKLVDVAPGGKATRILEGACLVDAPDPDRPVQVHLGDTGYRLLPGHRLRLEAASSNFPRYLLHPGTAENPWTATKTAPDEQQLRTGGAAGSCLTLTVL